MSVKYIDLDKLVDDAVVIKFKGVEHTLKPVTMKNFIVNVRDIQEIGTAPGIEKEIELSVQMLVRAFPTMTRELFEEMTLDQLKQLTHLAHANNGQTDSAVEADAAANENPPVAA